MIVGVSKLRIQPFELSIGIDVDFIKRLNQLK